MKKLGRFSTILFIFASLIPSRKASKDLHIKVEEPLDVTGSLFDIDFTDETDEYSSRVNMSINPGCMYNNCTLTSGIQVSIINVTVQDDPQQDVEQHWLWSVIGRPTVQAAITPPDDHVNIQWAAIFDTSDTGKSVQYQENPFYSGAVMLMNVRNKLSWPLTQSCN